MGEVSVAFRPFVHEDLILLHEWLPRPHVRGGYAQPPETFSELAFKYGPRSEPDSPIRAFVLQLDGEDAGYAQRYPLEAFPEYAGTLSCGAGVAGMDLFIADGWRTGRGAGRAAIEAFVKAHVFAEPVFTACVAGVAEDNAAALKAFERAGFARWKSVVDERGEPEVVLRRERGDAPRIAPIDLADFRHCARFRRAMYREAFGTERGLEAEMGEGDGRYRDDLVAKILALPEGQVHVRVGDAIAGQLEMRRLDAEPRVGYVSLVYVAPEFRGRGLGRVLHDHALAVSRARGCTRMRLAVALANAPAIASYERLGWRVAGPRDHREPMAWMERDA